MLAHSRIATLLAKRHDISYELFVINCTYIVSTQISTDISKKTFKAPVNVSRACITIQAGYVCVVRSGTAQDQAYHLPPNVCHGPKTSGSWRRTLKLFLGLRLYPKSGAYPLLGVTTILIGNFWGPLKQTNCEHANEEQQVRCLWQFEHTIGDNENLQTNDTKQENCGLS